MTKSIVKLFGLALVALPLAGCGLTGSTTQPTIAAAPPTPAASNSPILDSLDPADRARAEQARRTALDGKAKISVDWKSDSNASTHGSAVAGPLQNQGAAQCRQYSQTVYKEGVPSVARSTACRQPDGGWVNS